jgi:hypothetical protein
VLGDADVPWLVSQKVDRRALAALACELTSGQAAGPDAGGGRPADELVARP